MRHSVHLMLGNEFRLSLQQLSSYILKYGEENNSIYFNGLLLEKQPEKNQLILSSVRKKQKNKEEFISGIQDNYLTEIRIEEKIRMDEQNVQLIHFFDTFYRNTITINNPGDSKSLHLCVYLPLYDEEKWLLLRELTGIIMSLSISYQIDIIGLAPDTAFLFTPEDEKDQLANRRNSHREITGKVLKEIMEYMEKNPGHISNFLVMQNCQQDGLALKLDPESYTRIIGEFALLSMEHYPTMFRPVPTEGKPIKGLGLSVLNFDKYYFVQYLLSRTYLHIMDREKVTDQQVDINHVAQITQEKLKSKINLASDFYNNEVTPRLSRQMDHDRIIAEVTPLLNELVEDIGKDLQSFITDDQLSLPEKRAALATLLGMDDPLLTGYAFNQSQLVIDDLDMDPANIFIRINNSLRSSESTGLAVLSANKDAYLPLKEIKENRAEMRQSTTYIREKEEQLSQISSFKQDAGKVDKRLINNNTFLFEGQKYQLLSQSIKEKALSETYEGSSPQAESIDLRQGFSPIKNQGSQRSSVAFALTAIYEYILKNNKVAGSDLSEAYLYYNSRKKEGTEKEDTGSSFSNSLATLMEQGICTEELFPYNETNFLSIPSEEANKDAANRLVAKAKNVRININDIRSALEAGYPVAASFKLYNSFTANTTGFISRPTEEEIKSGGFGIHAMVICGYSDEKRVFIVRNSWGTDFGENGYCYLPYSYVGDKDLTERAYIITEVSSGYEVLTGKEKKMQLFFDTTDADIQYAVTKNLVDEEKFRLKKLEKKDRLYREEYVTLIERLGNNSLRNRLITGAETILSKKIEECREQKEEAKNTRRKVLQQFDRATRKRGIQIGSYAVGIWIALGSLFSYFRAVDILSSQTTWYLLFFSFAIVGLLFLYFPYRKKKRRLLNEDLEAEITRLAVEEDRLQKEQKITRLRMHVFGMVLDRLFNLQNRLKNKYNVILSFTGNLLTWYQEESQQVNSMDSVVKEPFISLLNNEVLDNYFKTNKEKIATDIRLYHFLTGYEISEEGIQKFKNQIKESIVNSINDLIKDFKVYSHISKDKNYPYLDDKYANITELLPILDNKSRVFLQLTANAVTAEPHKVVFIRTDEQREKNNWDHTYPHLFVTCPSSEKIQSPYKIIVLRLLDLDSSQIILTN